MTSLVCAFTLCLFALQYFSELKSPKFVCLGGVCKMFHDYTLNFFLPFAAKEIRTPGIGIPKF